MLNRQLHLFTLLLFYLIDNCCAVCRIYVRSPFAYNVSVKLKVSKSLAVKYFVASQLCKIESPERASFYKRLLRGDKADINDSICCWMQMEFRWYASIYKHTHRYILEYFYGFLEMWSSFLQVWKAIYASKIINKLQINSCRRNRESWFFSYDIIWYMTWREQKTKVSWTSSLLLSIKSY